MNKEVTTDNTNAKIVQIRHFKNYTHNNTNNPLSIYSYKITRNKETNQHTVYFSINNTLESRVLNVSKYIGKSKNGIKQFLLYITYNTDKYCLMELVK